MGGELSKSLATPILFEVSGNLNRTGERNTLELLGKFEAKAFVTPNLELLTPNPEFLVKKYRV